MKLNENYWNLGEIAKLPRVEKNLKEGDTIFYEQFVASRYLCIREATDNQQGILLKVLKVCLKNFKFYLFCCIIEFLFLSLRR